MTISSPCIKRCAIGGDTGLCLGCGRTLDEIARWGDLPELDRLAIMAHLPARLGIAALGVAATAASVDWGIGPDLGPRRATS